MEIRKLFNALDAEEGIFFSRELEQIKSKAYEVQYPELLARRLFPLDSTTDTGAATVTYQSWDHVGMAKLIHSYADDLPNVELTAKETTRKIFGEGISFNYSIQEIRNARFAGKPLEQRKANAARRQLLQLENSIAFLGDATVGIPGFINNANVNSVTIADGAGGTTDWASKTPDEIIADITNMTSTIRDVSNGVESPNTLLLPEAQFTLISTTPRSSTSDTTILNFILGSNAWIRDIIPCYDLKGAAPVSASYDSTDCMILYDRNPDKLWLEVPQDVEMLPAQEHGLSFKTPVHARTAGVIIAYPLSVAQGNGI